MTNYKLFTATNKKGAHIEILATRLKSNKAKLTAEIHHKNGKSRLLINTICKYNDLDIISYLKWYDCLEIIKH